MQLTPNECLFALAIASNIRVATFALLDCLQPMEGVLHECYACSRSHGKTSGEQISRTTKPDHNAPNAGLKSVARRNAREPSGKSAPGAAPRHAILSADWALRVRFRTVTVITHPVPVLHPFPNVSERVKESKSVWLFLAHRMGSAVRVVMELCNFN